MSLDTLIADTRQAIADDAANAHAVFTAQGTLVGVTEVDVSTGAHTFKMDEPPALGGADAAANPVQYALASLGSCQAITYRLWAAQLGLELDSITVRVEGDLDLRGFFGVDDAVRPGFTAVRVEVSLAGPESEERYAELAAAVDEHCPVLDLFKNPVPVSRALVTAGTLRVVLRDGSQKDFSAGEVMLLPPGHDAWTVGDQACTFVEFSKGNDYYS